jgi:hypothetical protein
LFAAGGEPEFFEHHMAADRHDSVQPMKTTTAAFLVFSQALLTGVAFAESRYYLSAQHLFCPYEQREQIEHFADTKSDAEKQMIALTAIYAGSCSVGSYELAIGKPTQFKTSLGNAYICFSVPESEFTPNLGQGCTDPRYLTSISEQQQHRSGQYKVVRKGDGFSRAECEEGGQVVLKKTDAGWSRLSLVFPYKPRAIDVPTSADTDLEIRKGCQGADYGVEH